MSSPPDEKLSWPKRAWIGLRFMRFMNRGEPPLRKRRTNHNDFVTAAKNLDLDALEELMNRRLRAVIVRHAWIVAMFATVLLGGLIALTVYLTAAPTILKIAVGPRDSEDVQFVRVLADKFRREHGSVRLNPIVMDGPVATKDIVGKPGYDLAVIRGEFAMSPDWPVVAILRQNAMVLMAPAPGARGATKDGKKFKPAKIEKVADLAGRRVGIVMQSEASPELLHVLLDHYGIPRNKVEIVAIEPQNLKAAIHDNRIDAILVAGPVNGKAIADAVAAASHDKKGPTFIEIDQADAIAQRRSTYDKFEIVTGAFGGSPARPVESVDSLSFPQYLVASKTLSDTTIAAFSKLLYASRQALAFELPGVVKIESPSTDKDSAVLVHPGTDAYLGDNQKSFFEKYGDHIFYGLLILPIFGSAIAGVAGYLRAGSRTRRVRPLYRLLQAVKKARSAASLEALDRLENEVDEILGTILQQAEREQLDEMGMMSFSLAIEQARLAIAERRAVLLSHQAGEPHRSDISQLASAAE